MSAIREISVVRCVLVCLFPLLAAGCVGDTEYHLDEQSFDTEHLRMVEQYTNLTLPAGSRGLRMFHKTAFDPAFLAKIEIPGAAHETFARQLEQIPHDSNFGVVDNGLTQGLTWWPPAKDTIKVERMCHPGGHVRAFLCQEGDRWLLYVEWWTV